MAEIELRRGRPEGASLPQPLFMDYDYLLTYNRTPSKSTALRHQRRICHPMKSLSRQCSRSYATSVGQFGLITLGGDYSLSDRCDYSRSNHRRVYARPPDVQKTKILDANDVTYHFHAYTRLC